MRIVFVGTVDFSRHCLEQVFRGGGEVVGVLTLAPEEAGFHADYADLRPVAAAHGVTVHHIRKINDPDVIELLTSLHPDVIFVFGWSQIVKREVLNLAPLGCIGVHPALLPRNRGRHPLIWALVEGLTESGLTFFHMDEGADSGDILWQKSFPIALEDDAAALYQKIKQLAVEAIATFVPQLATGTAARIPQDHANATYWRKRGEKDGEIQWSAPSMITYNLIRALARPYVGAHTFLNGQKIVAWRAKLSTEPLPANLSAQSPGTVLRSANSAVEIRTGDGRLIVTEYSAENAVALEPGGRLGDRS